MYGGERLRRRVPPSSGTPAGAAAGAAGAAGQTRTATLPATGTDLASDRRLARLRFGEATLIGAAQILALLPGISRSGVTMVAGLVGADEAVTSCDLRILVEEAAKPVASLNADVVVCGRDVGSAVGWVLVQGTVRPVAVVVIDVFVLAWADRNCFQLAAVRCGAGSIPAALRICQMVEGAILYPGPVSSPQIRR